MKEKIMNMFCDFLVIGSGIAGLSFAIKASAFGKVILITKKSDSESNTNYAQGGIACAIGPNDSFQNHINDTINAGAGLCNKKAVEIMVKEGPERIFELIKWNAKFTKSKNLDTPYHLDLAQEGGHSVKRIVHAKDSTGREIEKTLLRQLKSCSNIKILENHYAIELITNHHIKKTNLPNACYGAYVLETTKRKIFPIISKITCISTGGCGRVYLHTTNPPIATGDGIAMAYRAGAVIENMEFIQFHPTTLYHKDADSFLISEALRGFGAILVDKNGKQFMNKYHKMKSLAPRDIVARAIDYEMKKTGDECVFLDIRHVDAERVKKHFPLIYNRCKNYGIDITKDLIPVVPAAHYLCGGIKVNVNGETSIKNLFACGEVSCTGVHGANRLASNSLLEALVFSHLAANHATQKAKSIQNISCDLIPPWDDSGTIDTEEWILLSHNIKEVQSVMWDYVGIVRSNLRLERALRRIRFLEKETEEYYKRTKITPQLLELRNIVTTAKLIILSALKRKESRGLHYTTDYPYSNKNLEGKSTIIVKPIKK
jgi:L-aspartate oxidase